MQKILFLFVIVLSTALKAEVPQKTYTFLESNPQELKLEALNDGLLHLEYTKLKRSEKNIQTSPYVFKKDYSGPQSFNEYFNGIATSKIRLEVSKPNCVEFFTAGKNKSLAKICSRMDDKQHWHFTITSQQTENVYGLGQEFVKPGKIHGDWLSHKKRTSGDYGNQMTSFDDGATGNTQVPVLYALGKHGNFGLFIDNVYKQNWRFDKEWKLEIFGGDEVRFYFLHEDSLKSLRSKYMELTGHSPMPPKKMFGLWISEFGFDNWKEIKGEDGKISTLRKNNYPVDGVVFDNQWFGGILQIPGQDQSYLGKLSWDLKRFPNPKKNLTQMDNDHIGHVLIEEPYISNTLPEFKEFKKKGYLVKLKGKADEVVDMEYNPWWGKGGMLDVFNPSTDRAWHKKKVQPLFNQAGFVCMWKDLGEPEQYWENPDNQKYIEEKGLDHLKGLESVYYGDKSHAEVHNLYNFTWIKNTYDQLKKNKFNGRPCFMSRSASAGNPRHGTLMWSGDISTTFNSLKSHYNAHMHHTLSGFAYYGSDTGGFWRDRKKGPKDKTKKYDQLYTQWFADAAWTDVPLRPHAFNVNNVYETAPDRVGYTESNLANLRQRYELTPYYYSLAYQEYSNAELPVSPAVYHFENDKALRELGDQKMVGPYIMVKMLAKPNIKKTKVFLPEGTWINYNTNKLISSKGKWIKRVRVWQQEGDQKVLRAPAFVKTGAILPMMNVNDTTKDVFGHDQDKAKAIDQSFIVKVYPDAKATSFTVYEDDGMSNNYLKGQYLTTNVSQVQNDDKITITIEASKGKYKASQKKRDYKLQVFSPKKVTGVQLNGKAIKSWSQNDGFVEILLAKERKDKNKVIELIH